jgi:uncharacterized membrane protein
MHVRHSVTIEYPRQALYEFWRDFENLPRFMQHLDDVKHRGAGRSHWVAKAPAGRRIEWDAVIIDDVPGERIAWRSLPGADVPNSGAVRFSDTPDRGTEIIVDIHYDPPGGLLGRALARLMGSDPGQQLRQDLHRFKQIVESSPVLEKA